MTRESAWRRVAAGLGVAAVVASLGSVFAAAALAPWFAPLRQPLSLLGFDGVATAPLFNGGLIVGGALGAGFVVAVWGETTDPVQQGSLVVLLLAMVSMALTGVVSLPSRGHIVVAAAFFGLLTLGLLVWGAGDFSAGRPARGGALVVAALLHVAGWLWWAVYGWPGPGMAVPELLGAGALAVWAVWVSRDLWPDAGAA